MKKIVAYKVQLVYACTTPPATTDKPWETHGLQGWVPFGDPVATSVPGKENVPGESTVFQAFVKYED